MNCGCVKLGGCVISVARAHRLTLSHARNEGFDILHNGVPRTFRDQKAMAYEAARFDFHAGMT